ncbi:MAG: PAS-domain containing protein [Alphaproteobacteria bacterium]|nr:PAS-domain containing protein [Alphaproteobacteria bacterium]
MSLEKRLALMVTVTAAGLALSFVLVMALFVRPGLKAAEEQDVQRNLRRITEAVRRESEALRATSADWAVWDDTYTFVLDGNEQFRTVNLIPKLLETLQLDHMAILGVDGAAVWSRTEPPEAMAEGLDPLLRGSSDREPVVGLIATPGGPMVVAAHPILTSLGETPSRGTLVMGRLLEGAALERLADVVQLKVEVLPTTAEDPMSSLALADGLALGPAEGDSRSAHLRLDDIGGRPVAVLRAEIPRTLIQSVADNAETALALVAMASLAMLALMLMAVRFAVTRPLARLTRQVAALRASGDSGLRLNSARRDEVGELAAAFDTVLDDVERARSQLLDGIESIGDAFALWDSEDRLVLCNGIYRAMVPGLAESVTPGVRFPDLVRDVLRLDPEGASNHHAVERRLAARLGAHRNPDGRPLDWELPGRSVEIRERRTRDGGVVGIYIDVTESRRVAQELRRMVRELERSNQDLEQFAFAASHDLQEPLRMIAIYVQLLERRYGEKLDDTARDYLRFAVEGARRIQGQIAALLAYSLVDRSAEPPRAVDARQVLARVIEAAGDTIEESGARIEIDPLPLVWAEPSQLELLFRHLLGNALLYRRSGVRPEIRVTAQRSGHDRVFAVSDNGIGIEPEYHERIFMIFQRLHTRDRFAGSGMGLAICKRIVERHGGRIWIESQSGRGATFFFTLPEAVDATAPT